LLHNPHLNEIILDDFNGADKGREGFWRMAKLLHRRRFDTALLLLPTERAAWMTFFAGIPLRVGVGTKLYGVLTFMRGVSRKNYVPLRHEADYCMDLGRKIGVRTDDLATEIFITDEERSAGKQILINAGVKQDDTVIAMHIGSGNSAPNWNPGRYGELATYLIGQTSENVKIIYPDGTKQSTLPTGPRIIDLRAQLNLRQLMSVLSNLALVFSSNTGPMHIAAGLKIPTVSLFSPLSACSPLLWGPKGNESRILLPPAGFCQIRCPGDPKQCRLDEITVEDAGNAILDLLNSTRSIA
ncbi:MAG: glycosyltransferase family 9 protein, partial [bacterium]